MARPEEVTPELLRILEHTLERAAEIDADCAAHLYAMVLLARFRETRAYPLVVRIAALPSGVLDRILGQFVTQTLDRIMASVCGGDLAGIKSLIENENTDEWARGAALSSLVTLVAAGQKSRDEMVSYFADLFRGKLGREWSNVWNEIISSSCDIYPAELLGDIERAYDEDLVDSSYIGLKDVKRDLALGKDRVLARLAEDPNHRLIDDAVAEMRWWSSSEDAADDAAKPPASQPPAEIRPGAMAVTQVKHAQPKIGRNDPCPCGSGKKYTKCCGA